MPHKAGEPLPNIGPHMDIAPSRRIAKQMASRIMAIAWLRNWLDNQASNPIPGFVMNVMSSLNGIGSRRRLIHELQRCDAVYCVGAANLNDFARYQCVLPKCMLIKQAHELGIPAVVSSQTVGPLDLPWAQQAVVQAATRATYFSLRDGGMSKKLLISLGVDSSRLFSVGGEES